MGTMPAFGTGVEYIRSGGRMTDAPLDKKPGPAVGGPGSEALLLGG